MTTLKEEVVSEFERLEEDLHYTEQAHSCAGEQVRSLQFLVGGFAAVASAAAAASALHDGSMLTASLAVAATVAAGVLTFVRPQASADRHLKTARQLGDLRYRIRQVRLLDAHAGSGLTDRQLREFVGRFTSEKQALLAVAPNAGPVASWRAQRKVDADLDAAEETATADEPVASPAPV